MVAWVGAKILNQGFPLWKGAAYLATCYCGVVLSDVVRAPAPAPAAPPLFGCAILSPPPEPWVRRGARRRRST
jgi:hypothetical protein